MRANFGFDLKHVFYSKLNSTLIQIAVFKSKLKQALIQKNCLIKANFTLHSKTGFQITTKFTIDF